MFQQIKSIHIVRWRSSIKKRSKMVTSLTWVLWWAKPYGHYVSIPKQKTSLTRQWDKVYSMNRDKMAYLIHSKKGDKKRMRKDFKIDLQPLQICPFTERIELVIVFQHPNILRMKKKTTHIYLVLFFSVTQGRVKSFATF